MAAVPFLVVLESTGPADDRSCAVVRAALMGKGLKVIKVRPGTSLATDTEYREVLNRAADGVIERNGMRRRIAELEEQVRTLQGEGALT